MTALVPVYNEEKSIARTLECLFTQPLVEQIIVVDDGSTDATAGILSRFSGITVITNPRRVERQAASTRP